MPVDQPDLPDPQILNASLECAPPPTHPPHISMRRAIPAFTLPRLAEQLDAKLQQLGGGGGASASTSALHGASTNGGGAPLVAVVTPHAVNNSHLTAPSSQLLGVVDGMLSEPPGAAAAAAAVPVQVVPFAPSPSGLPSQSDAGAMDVHEVDIAMDVPDDQSDVDPADLGNDDEITRLIDDAYPAPATPDGAAAPDGAEQPAELSDAERAILLEAMEAMDPRARRSHLRQRAMALASPPPAKSRKRALEPATTYRSLGAGAEADEVPPAFRSLGSSPCTVGVAEELDEPVFRSAATGEEDEVYPNPKPYA
eukprot:scaffold4919_cov43-Phaeocystis_antarctica.AAC.3